jgi:hypothetical protein
MKEFQKIAIGLLELTHPELFLPKRRTGLPAPNARQYSDDTIAQRLFRSWNLRGARWGRALKFTFIALAIGSRSVALADNSQLVQELACHAAALYDPVEPSCEV